MEYGVVFEKVRFIKGFVMEGFREEWYLNGGRKKRELIYVRGLV